ncbi:tetratricopeptide repeat protein [Tellurirhabdus rosea]|uniref:tetratricopeptide repeat protein n=1 Tax=Tellurirhabdus rosea TaxID=2674997 RepID=UPI00224F7165|nr:tetratricopeptide repeat protein [Tellurirhabdus rosea]
MRYLYLLVCVLTGFSALQAQKVDLDEFSFHASYVQLPRNPLPAELTTYSTEFTSVGVNVRALGYNMADLQNSYFNISGFRKVARGGHFTIKIQIDNPQFGDLKEAPKTETSKGKDGKEVKTTTYAYSYTYYVPMRYVITDYQQNILEEGAVADGSQQQGSFTSYFATQAQLAEYWKNNRNSVLLERWQSFTSQALQNFSNRLNDNFGYVTKNKVPGTLWVLNSSKHPEFEAYQKQYKLIRDAFDGMTPAKGLDPALLQPALDYLESLPKKYPADEKADKKLRYSAYYNLGTIYYWLDEFDKSAAYADALIKNDYDRRDGEVMKNAALSAKARMTANRLSSRHFVRDLSKAEPPALAPPPVEVLAAAQTAEPVKTEQEKASESLYKLQGGLDQLKELVARMEAREKAIREEIKHTDGLIVKYPTDAKLYITRGRLKRNVYDWPGSVADFEKGVSLKPKEAIYHYELGFTAVATGEYDRGVKALDAAIALNPKYTEAYYQKGLALSRANRPVEAIPVFDKAIALRPTYAEALTERGVCREYLLKHADAIQDFDKAIAANPKYAYAYNCRGTSNFGLGKYPEALTDLNKAIELEKYTPNAYANRAIAYLKMGRLEEASKDAEDVVAKNKNFANGYLARALVRVQQKNFQGAIEDARQALTLNHPRPYRVHTALADALAGLGLRDEAIKKYDEALSLMPGYAEAVTGKAQAQQLSSKF